MSARLLEAAAVAATSRVLDRLTADEVAEQLLGIRQFYRIDARMRSQILAQAERYLGAIRQLVRAREAQS